MRLDEPDMADVYAYDHSGRVRARTSNGTLGIEPTDHGLFAYADLSRSSAAKELYEDISSGLIQDVVGVSPTVADEDYDKDNHTHIISSHKKGLRRVGRFIPANDATEISARSYFDGVIERERQELQERLEIAKRKYYYFKGSEQMNIEEMNLEQVIARLGRA